MEDGDLFHDAVLSKLFSRKRKEYRERLRPLDTLSETDFIKYYRFDKDSVEFLIELLRTKLEKPTNRGSPLSSSDKVLIFIRYVANGLYQKDVASVHNISQQSVTNVIREVSVAIASLSPMFIKFPETVRPLQELKCRFWSKYKFPQCIGAIDCTQIKIKNPGGELGARHRCRKGYYSLNVQVICDADGLILDVVSRWRGSAHDSRIWRLSRIKQQLECSEEILRGGVLLGDGGYANSKILLTPFRQNIVLTASQQRYQHAHVRARNIIEKVFGQLKNKFRICLNGLQVQLPTAKNIVVAISVLYNVAKIRNQPFENSNDFDDPIVGNELLLETVPITFSYRDQFIVTHFE